MGITLKQLQDGSYQAGEKNHITTYRHNDEDKVLLRKYHIQALSNDILRMNKNNSYTGILVCGKSGSGKTTLVQTLLHRMACKNRENKAWVVRWFHRDDLTRMDEIIDSLQKGLNYLLVFDDVSYVLNKLSSKRQKELAEKLTHIRHDLGGNVIAIFNIHYLKALAPIMRDCDFKLITSMTDQDAQNWKGTIGWNKQYKIDKFQQKYLSEMQQGFFELENPHAEKPWVYETNEPFRVALSAHIVGLDYLLFPKEGCKNCSPEGHFSPQAKQKLPGKEFLRRVQKSYGTFGKTPLAFYLFYKHGVKHVIKSNYFKCSKMIDEIFSEYNVDVNEVAQAILDDHANHKHSERKQGSREHSEKRQRIKDSIIKSPI